MLFGVVLRAPTPLRARGVVLRCVVLCCVVLCVTDPYSSKSLQCCVVLCCVVLQTPTPLRACSVV